MGEKDPQPTNFTLENVEDGRQRRNNSLNLLMIKRAWTKGTLCLNEDRENHVRTDMFEVARENQQTINATNESCSVRAENINEREKRGRHGEWATTENGIGWTVVQNGMSWEGQQKKSTTLPHTETYVGKLKNRRPRPSHIEYVPKVCSFVRHRLEADYKKVCFE